ncbi:MAG: DUF4492 domain-containing protein [Bacteroidales bacterium]|nr:DUF4492 domain-containing protein [Bacteroidales bacterium]
MGIIKRIFFFYYQGFKEMPSWGKKLWVIILIKLFVFFVVMKWLFFPNVLKKNFNTEKERVDHVLNNITKIK